LEQFTALVGSKHTLDLLWIVVAEFCEV